MSLGDNKGLSLYDLLELEVPDELVKLGLTHNAYSRAQVVPRLEPTWLKAVYKLDYEPGYSDKSNGRWIYPIVRQLKVLAEDILFPPDFDTAIEVAKVKEVKVF